MLPTGQATTSALYRDQRQRLALQLLSAPLGILAARCVSCAIKSRHNAHTEYCRQHDQPSPDVGKGFLDLFLLDGLIFRPSLIITNTLQRSDSLLST